MYIYVCRLKFSDVSHAHKHIGTLGCIYIYIHISVCIYVCMYVFFLDIYIYIFNKYLQTYILSTTLAGTAGAVRSWWGRR